MLVAAAADGASVRMVTAIAHVARRQRPQLGQQVGITQCFASILLCSLRSEKMRYVTPSVSTPRTGGFHLGGAAPPEDPQGAVQLVLGRLGRQKDCLVRPSAGIATAGRAPDLPLRRCRGRVHTQPDSGGAGALEWVRPIRGVQFFSSRLNSSRYSLVGLVDNQRTETLVRSMAGHSEQPSVIDVKRFPRRSRG